MRQGRKEGRADETERSREASVGWALHAVLRSLNFIL